MKHKIERIGGRTFIDINILGFEVYGNYGRKFEPLGFIRIFGFVIFNTNWIWK